MIKKASTQWTMAKLLTIILAVFLLVLIIYGVQNNGFGPLLDNIESRANEVLILLHVKGDGGGGCGSSSPQDITGVGKGTLYPCDNGCSFVLVSPGSLLGFSNFSINTGGLLMVSKDGRVYESRKGFAFDPVESQRHRDAYVLLNDTVTDFLAGGDMAEFIDVMDFGRGMTLIYEVDDYGDNTFYEYNGMEWKSGEIEWGVFDVKRRGLNMQDVKNEIWGVYYNSVSWNYKGDGKANVLMGDFNKNFKDVARTEGGLRIWFNNLTLEQRDDKRFVTIKIKGMIFNTYYSLEYGKWKKLGYFRNSPMDNEEVFNVIYNAHIDKYEIVWYYGDNENLKFMIGSNDKVSDGRLFFTGKENFEKWFYEMQNNWSESEKKQDSLLGDFEKYLGSQGKVGFDGRLVGVGLTTVEGASKIPMIYFDTGREKFGLYYKDGKPVLVYLDRVSEVSDFINFSPDKWEEFLKINKIYEDLRVKRCGW